MPLAWEATLSAKERKAFKVIYGVARAQEEIYEIMAELLLCHGIDGVTEKSFKASGVTVLLDKKTSITDVQIFGGWKSEQTPLFYVSKEFID